MTDNSVIRTKDLTKYFTPSANLIDLLPRVFRKKPVVKAVEAANITVEKGEIFGLLGPNGAGKTTLIKMLCTLIVPTRGTAAVNGYDTVKQGEAVRKSIGLVTGEERSFYWRLTGKQNLRFFGSLYNLKSEDAKRKIGYLIDLLDMREYIDVRFDEYSTGMKQHLAVARSLLGNAQILFMDEPTKSLDFHSATRLRRFIRERIVGRERRTVFFTTHILKEAEDFTDRIAVMDRGCVKAVGTVPELRNKIKNPGASIEDIFRHFT